jgi:hypothetical protein
MLIGNYFPARKTRMLCNIDALPDDPPRIILQAVGPLRQQVRESGIVNNREGSPP